MIVPTLGVGMRGVTLRVTGTRSVQGCILTRSVGTIKTLTKPWERLA